VRSSADLDLAVFLVVLPWLLGGLGTFFWALTLLKHPLVRPGLKCLMAELRGGLSAALANASAHLNQPVAVVVLGAAATGESLGVFGTAVTIIAAAKQVAMPMSHAAYAHTSYLGSRDPESVRKARHRAILWIGAAGALGSAMLFAAAPLATSLLFGDSYSTSSRLIRWMSPIPMFFVVGHAVGTQYLFSGGRGRAVVLAMVLGNLVSFAACLALVTRHGDFGAALGLLAGETVAFGLIVLAASRLTRG